MKYLVTGMHLLEKRSGTGGYWEVQIADDEGFKVILQLNEKPLFNPGDHIELEVRKANAES